MAFGTFEWPEKAQHGLGWLLKYYFPVLLSLGTCSILRKNKTMYNECWGHSWVEVNKSLCRITLVSWHYFPLLPITLTVT